MSGSTKEWLIVLIFFVTCLSLMITEVFWLSRKGWCGFGNAAAFSAVTNALGFTVGQFVLFITLAVLMAMAWDGSLARFPLGNFGIGATLIGASLFFPVFLTLCKRLFLKAFKIQTGKKAWLFALASSVVIFLAAYGLPILAGYILLYFL
jgi:hypothetical protein